MHIIHQHQTSITLFERNGNAVVFRSMKEALKKLGYSWITSNVGSHFRIFIGAAYIDYQYILRNDVGECITAESFSELRVKAVSRYGGRLFQHWNGNGPVPGTGKSSVSHYFRNIRYINAKRNAQHLSDEGEVAPRAARSANLLPDAWDDLKISSQRLRSWKRFRKTQWR